MKKAFTLAEGTTHVVMLESCRKAAFTLAEVLITLGIIGVVAAVTMPTLILKHQKQVIGTRLKQTYSQLYQAIQSAQVDYGDISLWDGTSPDEGEVKVFADKYILPYLKTIETPEYTTIGNKGYKNGFKTKVNEVYWKANAERYIAELTNGVTLFFLPDINFLVFVDVNGVSGPNIIGRDVYAFALDDKIQKIIPYGHNLSEERLIDYCSPKSQAHNYNNLYCTGLVMLYGWEIDDKYPW